MECFVFTVLAAILFRILFLPKNGVLSTIELKMELLKVAKNCNNLRFVTNRGIEAPGTNSDKITEIIQFIKSR